MADQNDEAEGLPVLAPCDKVHQTSKDGEDWTIVKRFYSEAEKAKIASDFLGESTKERETKIMKETLDFIKKNIESIK